MFGCDRRPAEFASRLKRARTSGSCSASNTSVRSILIATARSITESKASYTTPIAPRPICWRISYLPIFDGALTRPRLSLSRAPAVPQPREEIGRRGHDHAEQDRPQRLLVLFGERNDGEDLEPRHDDPD